MKNLLNTCLPFLALLALGGCAGTSALTSSEDDGVYYSSKDRTTAVVSQAPAPASTNVAANPDYNGNTGSSSRAPQSSGSTQYYDNSYTYMRGVPGYGSGSSYYGPGVSSYSPYSPYTTLSYAPYASYGYGYGGGYGYSPYGYGGYDPFYSSYYSPYGGYSPYYGYGSGVSISFGYGYGCGRPYGYGYGYSPYSYGYSPYYYGGSYYGGYYGRSGYYGNNYYGSNYYGNSYGGYRNSRQLIRADGSNAGAGSPVLVGPRGGRGGSVLGGRNAAPATPGSNAPNTLPNGGRRNMDGLVAQPNNPTTGGSPGVLSTTQRGSDYDRGKMSGERVQAAHNAPTTIVDEQAATKGRFGEEGDRRRSAYDTAPADNSNADKSRGGWRNLDTAPNPAVEQPSRRGEFSGESPRAADQPAPQPQREYERPQRTYEQPQQAPQPVYERPQRTYEQPQRTYEQPQRTYEQPQRTYEQPSNGGGGGGGGGGRRGGRD